MRLALAIGGLLAASSAQASITLGTVAPANPGTYETSLPHVLAVTLPAGVDGMVCGASSTTSDPNTHTAVWDSGGGTQASGTLIGTGRHTSGPGSYAFWWAKGDLPQGGVTDNVTFSGTNFVVDVCYPIQTTNDNGISIAQFAIDNEAAGTSLSMVLGMARASGSLIIAGAVSSTEAISFTFPTLATEDVDTQGAGGGGHTAAWAHEINPSETTTYGATQTLGSKGGIAVEVTENAADPGEFDVTPSVASQTATAYTVDGSLDAAGTVHAVACPKDQTAPSIAQIQAGDCTGDVNAMATDTDTPSNNFSLVLTLSNGFPIADLYITDGVTRTTLADEQLDCPLVTNCATPTSIHMTSPFFGTVVAVGDYVQIDSLTDPDAYATFILVDGTVSYAALGDTSRQLIGASVYDVSAEAMVDFLLVFNNGLPFVLDEWPLTSALYEVGTDPAFASEVYVDDPESDDLTWTLESGALPNDWSLNAGTGAISDGIPGACGGYDFTLRATDIYDGTLDLLSHVEIGEVVPDVEDDDEEDAIDAIEALCSFTAVEGTPECSATIVAGNVIETDPPIGTLVESDAEIEYILSTGPCPTEFRIPNCLSKTVSECTTLVLDRSTAATVTLFSGCSAAANDPIYSHSPAINTLVAADSDLLVYAGSCQ